MLRGHQSLAFCDDVSVLLACCCLSIEQPPQAEFLLVHSHLLQLISVEMHLVKHQQQFERCGSVTRDLSACSQQADLNVYGHAGGRPIQECNCKWNLPNSVYPFAPLVAGCLVRLG